jgi:peptidoglycan LD-endopeptidase CwlK
MMILNPRSEKNLTGVHDKLVAVVRLAATITEIDFIVTEGLRTVERQKELYAKGASTTMNSKHLTGHAVDLAAVIGTEVRWDWSCYYKLAEAMKQAAEDLGVDVKWGGNWKLLSLTRAPINARILSKSFPDGPHFEIDPAKYK